VPIIPALALSLIFEGVDAWAAAWTNLHWITVAALAFVVIFSTWAGFAVWGRLLSTYSASIAAPFALLVPVFGGVSAYVFLGETLSPQRLAGSLLIFTGLAIILLPLERFFTTKEKGPA
jgi:O-acetylserine/cysteine efflux transporter